jgi:peptidyl-prolyl cis-trans isomerase D
MLKHMRASANSGILKGIIFGMLTLGAVGLAFTSGNNFFRDGIAHDTTVASIGRVKIDARAFDQTVRRDLAQKSMDSRTAYQMGLINQLLEQQIAVNVMARGTQDLGINVGDDEVQKEIRRILQPATAQGLTLKEAAMQIMRAQGMSEAQFIEAVRGDTANQIVRGAFEAGTSVESRDEARDLSLYANEKRTVKVAFIPDAGVKDYKSPTDAVLKPFYEAGRERYAIPETRAFTVAVLTDKALDKKPVSDEDLRQMYEDQKASLAQPEQRTLDQAILQTKDQADAVADAARKGKSLKDAVKEATGDTKAFTGTQSYQREGLSIKGLADAAFAAKKGDVVGPVQSPLGWHVAVVKDIAAPGTPTFESMKDRLRAAAENEHAGEALYTLSTQLDDDLAGGGSLDEAVKTYRLDTVKVGPVHQDGSTPDKNDGLQALAADSAAILKTAFGLSQDETSPVFGLSGGRYAVVHLDSVTPKSYKPFEEVKADLSKVWIADQQNVLNKDRVKDSLVGLKNGKLSLEQMAQSMGGSVKTMQLDRFMQTPPQPLTASAASTLFGAGKGAFMAQTVPGGMVVGTVESVTLPALASIPEEKIKGVQQISMNGMRESILQTYLNALRKKYSVRVNDALLKETYDKDTGTPGADPNAPDDQ